MKDIAVRHAKADIFSLKEHGAVDLPGCGQNKGLLPKYIPQVSARAVAALLLSGRRKHAKKKINQMRAAQPKNIEVPLQKRTGQQHMVCAVHDFSPLIDSFVQ